MQPRRGCASVSFRSGVGKPREVRIYTVGENVLEPAFDTKPLCPHISAKCGVW
jgi:hypothetical protein